MCKCLVSQLLYALHLWQNAGVGIEANIRFCVHNVATHGVFSGRRALSKVATVTSSVMV